MKKANLFDSTEIKVKETKQPFICGWHNDYSIDHQFCK
jgi:hypothetical protein